MSKGLIRISLEFDFANPPRGFHSGRRMNVIEERRRPRESFVSYQLLCVDAPVRLPKRDVPFARNLAESVIDRHRSEIPAQRLLALECLE